MKIPDNQTIFMTRPEGLARILAVDDNTTELWNRAEMQAMWQHQLSAPMHIDLESVVSVRATELRNSPRMAEFKSKTFADLLQDPSPPVELLKLTKEFAKQTLKDAEEAQLKDVATALYYASYAAGLLRCGELIGSMNRGELRPGFDWTLRQPWLDEKTKGLICEARGSLEDQKTS
jgi:hypothetical protein